MLDTLVDVDIDCAEAVALPDLYLPGTRAIGRPSKPKSDRIYTTRVGEAHPGASEAVLR
jgi:hypothetical protein